MLRTYIFDAYSAATRKDRGLRFFPFSTGRPLFAVLAIAAAAIGITVFLLGPELTDYEPFREETVQMTGTVCSLEPKLQEDTVVWRMLLSDVRIESPIAAPDAEGPESDTEQVQPSFNLNKKDQVLCILDHQPGADMSARVRVRGKLYPFRGAMNEGEFDLRMYYHILRIEFSLRNADILAVSAPADRLSAALFLFKRYLSSIIDRLFSQQNSPVLKAMLLGEKGLLEEETRELYQGAGIIHVLSISGVETNYPAICGIS